MIFLTKSLKSLKPVKKTLRRLLFARSSHKFLLKSWISFLAFVVGFIAPYLGPLGLMGRQLDLDWEIEAAGATKTAIFRSNMDTFVTPSTTWSGNDARRMMPIGFYTDYTPEDGPDYYWNTKALIRFDRISLEPGAIVTGAKINVWMYGANDANTVKIERVTSGWSESTVNPGPSSDGKIYGQGYFPHYNVGPGGSAQLVSIPISDLSLIDQLQSWNGGVMLRNAAGDSDDGLVICSRNIPHGPCKSGMQPALEIEYEINQPPFTPLPALPANQAEFGGSCDESTTPPTGNCRTGETVGLRLNGIGDPDPEPGWHRYIHYTGTNVTTGETFDERTQLYLDAGQKVSRTLDKNLADGKYNWHGYSYDALNTRGLNSVAREFTIDTTPPEVPVLPELADFTPGVGIDDTTQFEVFSAWAQDNISVDSAVDYILQYSKTADFSADVFEKPGQRFTDTDPRIELGPKGIDEIAGTEDDIQSDTKYYFRAKARDEIGNISAWSNTVSSFVDSSAPEVTDVVLDKTRFSPQNDSSVGADDELNFSFSYTKQFTKEVGFEILNNAYEVIYTFVEPVASPDQVNTSVAYTWDGLTVEGEVVPDGSYIIRPVATDLAGNGITIKESDHQRVFTLDNSGVDINFNQLETLWVKDSNQTLTGQVIDTGDLASFEAQDVTDSVWKNFADISGANYDEDTDQFSYNFDLTGAETKIGFRTVDVVANVQEYTRTLLLDQNSATISNLTLTNSETGASESLDSGSSVAINDLTPEISFDLADSESGIQIGTNPKNVKISANYQAWDRENQVFVDTTRTLFESGINLDSDYTSDLECVVNSGAATRNGIAVAAEASCRFDFLNLGDSDYTLEVSASDLVSNTPAVVVSDAFEVDASVYGELRAPVTDATYPTANVLFVGFGSREATVFIENTAAGVAESFVLEPASNPVSNTVCDIFINHDNDPDTPDEEVCRWQLELPQYTEATGAAENFNTVTFTDGAGNVEVITANTKIDTASFELAVNSNFVYLSPNGDGQQDTVNFVHFAYNPNDPFNQPQIQDWKLEIIDLDGVVVKDFSGSGQIPIINSWDLTTDSGLIPDGEYRYTLRATSIAGVEKFTEANSIFVNSQLEDTTVISNPQTGLETSDAVVNISGQAPATVPAGTEETALRGQVYTTICVDTLVPEGIDLPEYVLAAEVVQAGDESADHPAVNYGQGNNVECDHWQEVLVDENGYFETIVIFPEVEGIAAVDHEIHAISYDEFGNSTPYSNNVSVTTDGADPFVDVTLEPTLTGVTSEADYEKFLNGELNIDDIRALRVRSVVGDGTEQVQLSFAGYADVTQRPDSPSFNYISTITDLTETDTQLNPLDLATIKYNHNKAIGDRTIPYDNCELAADSGLEGCVWDYYLPLTEDYGGIYEIEFIGKRGTIVESMTRGFQVDGKIPPAPVFMVVEKWDAEDETWVKMENVDYDNFTDTSRIRFRGAAEPGTKVELWTQDTLDADGNVVSEGVKFVDMIVGNTGVWEFVLELDDYIDSGGDLGNLPGGPGNPDGDCAGLDCLKASLGFVLKGYLVDRYGQPTQLDEDGNPIPVESEEEVVVNYDTRAPKLVSLERQTAERTVQGWARTGDQALFNLTVDEELFTGELMKEDGFARLLTKLDDIKDAEGKITSEDWTAVINVDDPEEGIYNVQIRLKDLAENLRTYSAPNWEANNTPDFRIFVDNTAPDSTEIIDEGPAWSTTWEEGGVNASPDRSYEVGRTNPAFVTNSDNILLSGQAELGQRVEIFATAPVLDEDGNLVQKNSPLIDRGGEVIATIDVSDDNCIGFDFDKVTADGLTTKYNSYCDWNYEYNFPDDGENTWDGVPLHGYIFQARVIDSAANESDWSNTVVAYHDKQAPGAPVFFEAKSSSYETQIPRWQTNGNEGNAITKDFSVDLGLSAERFSDVELAYKNPVGDETKLDLFINESDRNTTTNFELGTQQTDDRDGCVELIAGRRTGVCSDGTYQFAAKSTDAVGYAAETSGVKIERDTVAPANPTANASRSGSLISLNVSAEPNAKVLINGSDYGQMESDGNKIFNLGYGTCGATYTYTVVIEDAAGNSSQSTATSVTMPVCVVISSGSVLGDSDADSVDCTLFWEDENKVPNETELEICFTDIVEEEFTEIIPPETIAEALSNELSMQVPLEVVTCFIDQPTNPVDGTSKETFLDGLSLFVGLIPLIGDLYDFLTSLIGYDFSGEMSCVERWINGVFATASLSFTVVSAIAGCAAGGLATAITGPFAILGCLFAGLTAGAIGGAVVDAAKIAAREVTQGGIVKFVKDSVLPAILKNSIGIAGSSIKGISKLGEATALVWKSPSEVVSKVAKEVSVEGSSVVISGSIKKSKLISLEDVLARVGKTGTYKEMQKLTKNLGGRIQAHHILEQRMFVNFPDLFKGDTKLVPSVVLERDVHSKITNELRKSLPYGDELPNWLLNVSVSFYPTRFTAK